MEGVRPGKREPSALPALHDLGEPRPDRKLNLTRCLCKRAAPFRSRPENAHCPVSLVLEPQRQPKLEQARIVRGALHGVEAPTYRGYTVWRGILEAVYPGHEAGVGSEMLGSGKRFGLFGTDASAAACPRVSLPTPTP